MGEGDFLIRSFAEIFELMQTIIEFTVWGAPESWSNDRPWSRGASIGQHRRMKDWTDKVIIWGHTARRSVGWELAQEGHKPRWVRIHQYRHGILDDDNLFTSIKPLLDGCKTHIRRKKQTTFGSGLIWNDNPRHCQLEVTQERVSLNEPCRVVIKVERIDL